jgi:hypothetical protein
MPWRGVPLLPVFPNLRVLILSVQGALSIHHDAIGFETFHAIPVRGIAMQGGVGVNPPAPIGRNTPSAP